VATADNGITDEHSKSNVYLDDCPRYKLDGYYDSVFEHSQDVDSILDLNNFKNEYKMFDSEELGLFIDQKLSKIAEGQTIKLPDTLISVEFLHIPRSCKIIGCPETVLEVSGSILVGSFIATEDEFSSIDHEDKSVNVHFWELEIQYTSKENETYRFNSSHSAGRECLEIQFEENKISPDTNHEDLSPAPMYMNSLFVLDSFNGVSIEVRDWNIKLQETVPQNLDNSSISRLAKDSVYVFSSIEFETNTRLLNKLAEYTNQSNIDFCKDEGESLLLSRIATTICK